MSHKLKSALFATLLIASLSRKVRAEHAVGLDAQGVDPLTALHNPMHLDVRDALGRPVSAAVLAQELTLAARGRAKLASFASRLPKARLLAALAEFFAGSPLATLSTPHRWTPLRQLFAAAPHARPELGLLLVLALFLPVVSASAWSTSDPTPLCVARSHRKIASLRI